MALRFGAMAAALVVLLAFAKPDLFFSSTNLQVLGFDAGIIGLPAVGLALVMFTGGIDLSVGATMGLSA